MFVLLREAEGLATSSGSCFPFQSQRPQHEDLFEPTHAVGKQSSDHDSWTSTMMSGDRQSSGVELGRRENSPGPETNAQPLSPRGRRQGISQQSHGPHGRMNRRGKTETNAFRSKDDSILISNAEGASTAFFIVGRHSMCQVP